MNRWIHDTVGLGTALWLLGYLASLLLFFSPFSGTMGWIITAVFTPVTIAITWWWFRTRGLPLSYYVVVGAVWTVIAIVLDYLFIVRLFRAAYYGPDVFVYYALTFLIPVGVGLYLRRTRGVNRPGILERTGGSRRNRASQAGGSIDEQPTPFSWERRFASSCSGLIWNCTHAWPRPWTLTRRTRLRSLPRWSGRRVE